MRESRGRERYNCSVRTGERATRKTVAGRRTRVFSVLCVGAVACWGRVEL